MRWQISNIIHGEQGALNLSTGLADVLLDAGAQEYVTNQAREEARHVTGFSYYMKSRWGTAYPAGEVLGDLLEDLINTPVVYKKLVGMQMLLEGLALGAFANLHKHSRDPVLCRLVQLVKTARRSITSSARFGLTRQSPTCRPPSVIGSKIGQRNASNHCSLIS